MLCVIKKAKTEVLHLLYSELNINPKIDDSKLHKKQSMYKARRSTAKLLAEAMEDKIIVGPFLYCNSGTTVDIFYTGDIEDPVEYLDVCRKNPLVTRAVILLGEHSFLCFKKGASILTYAEAIRPTLNSSFSLDDIRLTEKGKLPVDPYPHGWDDLDWEIYHRMRYPRVAFSHISQQLRKDGMYDVTYKTVETRYKNLVNDCKIMAAFFPRGMDSYSQTFLAFQTDYEENLRLELQKLDRSSYIYKIGDTILLNLFLDNNIEHRIFVDLKKKEKIRDLHVSMPVYFWTPFPV
jgi:hypothetical protein